MMHYGAVGFWASLQPVIAQSADPLPGPVLPPSPPLSWQLDLPGQDIVRTDDPAVPGAQEVLTDTPNVFAWSRAQSGSLSGWSYRLFPDGSAIVLAEDDRPYGEYLVRCTLAQSCSISNDVGVLMTVPAIGAPKPALPEQIDGLGLARYLAQWVLAGSGTPPPPPPAPDPPPPLQGPQLPTEDPAEPPPPEVEDLPETEETEEPSATADTLAFLSGDIDCTEPDPYYPDACTPPASPSVAPAPQPARNDTPPRTPRAPTGTSAPDPQPEPDKPQTLAQRFRLNCSISTGAGLQYVDHRNQDTRYGKLRVSLGCSARINDRLSMNLALVHFPISGQQAPWDPDFTYAFNFKATDKLNISYSSYSARFSSAGSDIVSSLLDGSFRGSYKLPKVPLPLQKTADCSLGFGLPNPTNESLSLACGMSVTEKLRVGLTTYLYPSGKQEPWNPDYTYTASYKVNDRMQVNYSNYSSNRWPWNRGSNPGPGLLGGSLSLSYKLIF